MMELFVQLMKLKFRANSWKSRPWQVCHHSGQAKNVENVLFMRFLPTAER